MKAKDISSVEIVNDLYQVILYKAPNCKGSRLIRRVSSKVLASSYDNQVCSVVIEVNPTGITSPLEETENGAVYNLAGQRLSKMQKGINIINGKKILR